MARLHEVGQTSIRDLQDNVSVVVVSKSSKTSNYVVMARKKMQYGIQIQRTRYFHNDVIIPEFLMHIDFLGIILVVGDFLKFGKRQYVHHLIFPYLVALIRLYFKGENVVQEFLSRAVNFAVAAAAQQFAEFKIFPARGNFEILFLKNLTIGLFSKIECKFHLLKSKMTKK